jgi:hypothetical protein
VISMFASRVGSRHGRAVLAGLAFLVLTAASAAAQAPAAADPNPGALTFSGAYDIPTIYMFRGIRQEIDPGFTSWPYADLKIDLSSGTGGLKSSSVNFGVWNSLHTGSSGTGGASEKLHYEEDFYAALNLGFGGATTFTTQFTAYTSPNAGFTTVKEILFKVSQGSKYAPYGLVAFELGAEPGVGQADGGQNGGTYMELGVGPSWPLGSRATLTVPVKLGFSLSDYYESPNDGNDNKFGFIDIGGLITVPISRVSSRYGSWNVHFGGDYFHLGETTHSFNKDVDGNTSPSKFVGLVGIGLSY